MRKEIKKVSEMKFDEKVKNFFIAITNAYLKKEERWPVKKMDSAPIEDELEAMVYALKAIYCRITEKEINIFEFLNELAFIVVKKLEEEGKVTIVSKDERGKIEVITNRKGECNENSKDS